MTNITHGMALDEVAALGQLLQSKAEQLRTVVAEVEAAINSSRWQGGDADRFRGQWWPEHKARLHQVAEHVHGFGQSALNNVSEQQQASSAAPGTTIGSAAVAGSAGLVAGVTAASVGTSSPVPAPDRAGAALGQLTPHGGVEGYRGAAGLHDSGAAWAQGPPANGQADRWGKAANNCTSWVAYRRSELGLSVPRGNGGAMGLDPNVAPTLGAVVSWGSGRGTDYGHVMFVEEVMSPDQFRVSEMNHDNRGGFTDSRVWTRQADGTWHCDQPYSATKVLKFTP